MFPCAGSLFNGFANAVPRTLCSMLRIA